MESVDIQTPVPDTIAVSAATAATAAASPSIEYQLPTPETRYCNSCRSIHPIAAFKRGSREYKNICHVAAALSVA